MLLVHLSVSLALSIVGQPARTPPSLWSLADLPRLRSTAVAFASSADPSGKNDDGFSGAHSFRRKEGDGLVIAEFQGPGVITRFWTPTPTDDPVEFFFDGEATPRLAIAMRAMFLGSVEPFRPPLVGFGAGGYYSYLPIPFARSIKVVVRGPRVQFFQINVARLDSAQSYRANATDPERDQLARLLSSTERNLAMSGASDDVIREVVVRPLQPGRRTALFRIGRGGRILGLRLTPASALLDAERTTKIRVTWDGAAHPAVDVPLADLFGFAWGKPALQGLLAGVSRDTAYLWFPMPFDRTATLELEHAAAAEAKVARAELFWTAVPRRVDEGRLHAVWRRENPTTPGEPFRFLRATGRGHVVGVMLQAQGLGTDGTPFFEGDDRVVIDGDSVVRGTGSEDAFNGGWYDVPGRWDGPRSFPLSGALGYSNPLARTGGYRFFLGDAYVWQREIDFTIEHGEDLTNAVATDYSGVTLFYTDRPAAFSSTAFTPENRHPTHPSRITLNPGWSSPIVFFSTQHARLTKRPERGIGRYLSFVGDSTPDFGRHVLSLAAPIPIAGRYRVSMVAVMGPDQGTVQLLLDDQPTGRAVPTAAESRALGSATELGVIPLNGGEATIHLRIDPPRAGVRRAALDLVRVVLERLPD